MKPRFFQEKFSMPAVRSTLGAFALGSILATAGAGCGSKEESVPKEVTVFFGTYTQGWACDAMVSNDCYSKGIYSAKFDTETGKLSKPKVAAETVNPSYLAIAPNKKNLYAVNEYGDYPAMGSNSGSVSAFAINDDNTLKQLNVVSSKGADPTHIWITKSGKTVMAANYSGGSVIAFGVKSNGALKEGNVVQHMGSGPNQDRQKEPHAHFIMEARNGLVYAADLGVDKVFIYKLDEDKATLTPSDPPFATLPPGSGPRHIAFHPTKDIVYVNAELTTSVVVFKLQADGGLKQIGDPVSAVPADMKGMMGLSTAEVQVTPDGKFLLVSVRGSNNISVFSIADDGKLKEMMSFQSSGGKTPRDFKVAPAGRFVLVGNQASNLIAVYEVQSSGDLEMKGKTTDVSKPVNFAFLY